jgi:hypothetical protein
VDVAVPIVYVLALVVAIMLGDAAGIGGVAVIGAMLVGLYFAVLRQNLKPGPTTSTSSTPEA